MSFMSAAIGCVGIPAEWWHPVEDASAFDVKRITKGVIILFASWSGPAHGVLKAYLSALQSLKADIPLYLVNIDTLSAQSANQFPELKHAVGETYLVRNGAIVAKLTRPVGVTQFLDTFKAAFHAE